MSDDRKTSAFGARFNMWLKSSWLLLTLAAAAGSWAARAELALKTLQDQVVEQRLAAQKTNAKQDEKLDKMGETVQELAKQTAVFAAKVEQWTESHEVRHDRRSR